MSVVPLRRPNGLRLLDLCCGAGGLSMGYYLAGFDVDIRPQRKAVPPAYAEWIGRQFLALHERQVAA